jgi:hypothetical protein
MRDIYTDGHLYTDYPVYKHGASYQSIYTNYSNKIAKEKERETVKIFNLLKRGFAKCFC